MLFCDYHSLGVNLLPSDYEGVEVHASGKFIAVDGDVLHIGINGNLLEHLARHVEDADVGIPNIAGKRKTDLGTLVERVRGILIKSCAWETRGFFYRRQLSSCPRNNILRLQFIKLCLQLLDGAEKYGDKLYVVYGEVAILSFIYQVWIELLKLLCRNAIMSF